MKKYKPQKILAGGILSLSFLLTSIPSFAGPQEYVAGTLGKTEETIYQAPEYHELNVDVVLAAQEQKSQDEEMNKISSPDAKTDTIYQAPESHDISPIIATLGKGPEVIGLPPRVDTINQDILVRPITSYLSLLSHGCLSQSELTDLYEACGRTSGCVSSITPGDDLDSKYFTLAFTVQESECTTANQGVIESGMAAEEGIENPSVKCAYVKTLCR